MLHRDHLKDWTAYWIFAYGRAVQPLHDGTSEPGTASMYLSIQRQWVVFPDGETEADPSFGATCREVTGKSNAVDSMQLSIQLIHSTHVTHELAARHADALQ